MKRRSRVAIGIGGACVAVAAFVAIDRSPGASGAALPTYWTAPSFALVDQTGETLRSEELRGSVWVASFVFTSCEGVCPVISARMARLGDELRRRGLLGEAVRLVSFSVDPDRDSPAALLEYAERFGAFPPSEWAWLTGQTGEAARAMMQRGFRVTAVMPEATEHTSGAHHASYQVLHSPRVLLIDGDGLVRGIYDGAAPEMPGRVAQDIARLLRAESRRLDA